MNKFVFEKDMFTRNAVFSNYELEELVEFLKVEYKENYQNEGSFEEFIKFYIEEKMKEYGIEAITIIIFDWRGTTVSFIPNRFFNRVVSICEDEARKKHFNNYDEFEEKVYPIVKDMYILSFHDEQVFVCNIIEDYYNEHLKK